LQALADTGVPRIHFGVGTAELLELMGAAGAEVIGVDWRLSLAEASRRVGQRYALQGNLDPALLSTPWPALSERVREVITSGAVAPGHIFNLGHGVPPDTDPGVLAMIVELVHSEGAELRRQARDQLTPSAAAGGR
jgi:uroporphyrinogen decarboxylase